MKNRLSDLNDHLFAQLERLPEEAYDDAPPELKSTIMAVARLEHSVREKARK